MIRQALEQVWVSLGTLEFREDAFPCDEQGRPDLSRGSSRRDYALAPGGRRASRTVMVGPGPDEERLISDLSRDGKYRYLIHYFQGSSEVIDSVKIESDSETHDESPTIPVHAMSFLTPFGRPLFRYLDDPETSLTARQDDEGREVVVLTTRVRGLPVRMELDPGRDWIVRRYQMGDDHEARVSNFGRDNGRWFPTEGIKTNSSASGVERSRFTVTDLRINRPVDESRFRPPTLAEGVLVFDGPRREARIIGGSREIRARYEAKHAPERVSVATPPPESASFSAGTPIVASTEPPTFPWGPVLGATGLIILVTAVALGVRRS